MPIKTNIRMWIPDREFLSVRLADSISSQTNPTVQLESFSLESVIMDSSAFAWRKRRNREPRCGIPMTSGILMMAGILLRRGSKAHKAPGRRVEKLISRSGYEYVFLILHSSGRFPSGLEQQKASQKR